MVQPQQEDFELGLPDHEDPISYEDIEMNDITSNSPNNPPVPLLPRPGVKQLCPGRFVEMFKGCGEMFPGSKTFMDDFWANQYAEERCDNVYYPWALKQEWAFASWLLRSHLSMAAIDTLLLLDVVSNTFSLVHSLISCRSNQLRCPFALRKSLEPEPKYFHRGQSGYAKPSSPSIPSSSCFVYFIAIRSSVFKLYSATHFSHLIFHSSPGRFGPVLQNSVESTMNG